MTEVPQLDGRQQVNPEELKLATHLLGTMATSMSNIDFRDRYSEALREMIDAKVQGKEIVAAQPIETPTIDIMTALKASIDRAKTERQPMVKATGKAKKAEPAEGEPAAAEPKSTRGRKRTA